MTGTAAFSPKQRHSIVAAIDSDAPVIGWDGSVRSGKTLSSEIAWLEFIRTGPKGPLIMIGRSLDSLERNVVQPLMEMLPAGDVKHARLTTMAVIFGRTVWLIGANDARAEGKIRGLTLAGAYVDEASLLPHDFWRMLRTRLSVLGAKLFYTTNPDNPRHWLKDTVINKAAERGYETFHFTIRDNPSLNAAYVAEMEASFTGLFYKRFILGQWVAAEGAVYDMLDLGAGARPGDTPGEHRVTWAQVPYLERFALGIDYGTTNPTHAVLLGAGTDQRMYVVAEWRHDARKARRQLTDAQQSRRLADWLSSGAGLPEHVLTDPALALRRRGRPLPPATITAERIGIDPVAASFRRQLAADGWGGITRPPDDSVVDGIRWVSTLIGAGRLRFVDGAAPELEGELLGYSWDEKQAEKGVDQAVKADDHGPDALRYAVMASRYVWRGWVTLAA